jgi:beta-lactamase regulating signal transducer with metallopeptidase domain
MNAILEQINSAGFVFVKFALPMLVQSSILIVALLLAELLLRKKVRAVFRYWLWMLVLIKLVLPTTLSSPVSIGSWFGDKLASIKVSDTSAVEKLADSPQMTSAETSTARNKSSADAGLTPVARAATLPVVSPAPLIWQGIVFLIWAAVVVTMGLLLLQRVIFVTGLVAQAQDPTQLMNDVFRFCCGQMGTKGKVGLKISANTASPAVCGLFRPVILVPQNLAPTLGSSHLRPVLLHELAHIRRGDLWINLVQTILQIFYFYNPLLWLANSIIRRIREQAVDETVQVTMGANAPQYPQTLVDVAKLAFNRPVLSLRLIGVVESKSTLKGRIERMLNRPMPKTAKLGILGLITVLIFAAVLLPMAKAEGDKKNEVGDGAQFIAKLDNGITIKLLGVCEHPSEGKQWWRPDGTATKRVPYISRKGNPIVNSNEEIDRLIEIAVGLLGADLQDVSVSYKVLGATKTSTNDVEIEGLKSIACEVSKLFSSVQVNIGVAAGSWETIGVQKADIKEAIEKKINDGFITWDAPLEKRGEAAIKVAHSFGEYDYRVIAKEKNGSLITSPWSSGGGADTLYTTEYRFPVHLAQIDEFQFQIRPYKWVEFKNVSLRPGVKTNVQVNIKEQVAHSSAPRVISTTPAVFDDAVSPEIDKITVTFDQPMMDKNWSWTGSKMFPKTTGHPRYNKNRTTCSLPVELEPGKVYRVGINSQSHQNFKSANGAPAKQYVILFATKDSNGKPTPIPEDLLEKARAVNEQNKAEPTGPEVSGNTSDLPYTQEMFNDIQPDGTSLFKSTMRQINQTGEKITNTSFVNSDFVHVTGMSDAESRPLKFTSTHDGNTYYYNVTFNKPVEPGELMEYSLEGRLAGLVHKMPGTQQEYRYHFQHWPQAHQPTRRIETYLLPVGAKLISKTPEDMQQQTKNGRIELRLEKMIPPGSSITTAFQYRLTDGNDIGKIVDEAVLTISTCAETDPRVKRSLESLQGLDEQVIVKEIVKFLDSDKNTVRRSAIYILWQGNFKSIESAIPSLQNLCSHEEEYTRGMASLALGAKEAESAFDTLCKMTSNDPSPYARRCAAYALGLMGNPKAKDVLEKATKDSDFGVRSNAEAALTILSQAEKLKSEKTNGLPEQTARKGHPLRVYKVNRSVADFPEEEDFSTPESAYAAINRVSAGDEISDWIRVSTKKTEERFAGQKNKEEKNTDSEWAKVLLNAAILEVHILDENHAAVIADLPQQFSSKTIINPVDVRQLELEDGRWLNTGNDRFATTEQARAKFGGLKPDEQAK